MTVHEAVCEDCGWSVRDEDLLAVSDQAERHASKEFHEVDVERAVATDGGQKQSPDKEQSSDEPDRFTDLPTPDRFFLAIEPAELEMRPMDHDEVRFTAQNVPGGKFGFEIAASYSYAGRECKQHVCLDLEGAVALRDAINDALATRGIGPESDPEIRTDGGIPPERPPEAEACPDCGYPIDACECASLFADDPVVGAPERIEETTSWTLEELHDAPWSEIEDANVRVRQEVDNRDPLDPAHDDRADLVTTEEREGKLVGRAEGTGLYYDSKRGKLVPTSIGPCIYLDTPEETTLEVRTNRGENELLDFERQSDAGGEDDD